MAIRYSSSCTNCAELAETVVCNVHNVKVSPSYTCDSFSAKLEEFFARKCSNCIRFNTESCAHPESASPEMLCTKWAPTT
ncbi:MAG: hypothetical protein AAFV80_00555 [Bacteroidota bacterium]